MIVRGLIIDIRETFISVKKELHLHFLYLSQPNRNLFQLTANFKS